IRDWAATSMLDPILKNSKYVSDYYAIWILSIFAASPSWNHADKLLTILRETRSDAVRRYAALALATAGTRAEVLTVKHNLQAASHLCRTAMMMATSKMGRDERKYLRQSLRLHDTLEKLCMS